MLIQSQQNVCQLVYKACVNYCCLVYVYIAYFPVQTSASCIYLLCMTVYVCAYDYFLQQSVMYDFIFVSSL